MKQLKKFALICIALVGFTLITQAAVNALTPKPTIVSATNILESETNNNGGIIELVVEFMNTRYVDIEEYIDNEWKKLGTFEVEYSGKTKSVKITITGLTPGLHTFRAIARISEDDPDGAIGEPFTVYVNVPQN